MVIISLAIDNDSVWQAQERYDAYVSYDQIDSCKQYVWFMECVVERIDNAEVRRIYKNNIYTTVRNRAEFEGEETLVEICDDSLQSLWTETILHKYGCTIESDDIAIRNLVLPDALKETVVVDADGEEINEWSLNSEAELLSWDSDWIDSVEGLSWDVDAEIPLELVVDGWSEISIEDEAIEEGWEDEKIDEESATPWIIEIITVNNNWGIDLELEQAWEAAADAQQNKNVPYTRVEVLQNRVWFLRIRERATTNSFEIWRLWIWNVVDVIWQEGSWYLIVYGDGALGWVSGKYVRNIGLPPAPERVLEVQWEIISLE